MKFTLEPAASKFFDLSMPDMAMDLYKAVNLRSSMYNTSIDSF